MQKKTETKNIHKQKINIKKKKTDAVTSEKKKTPKTHLLLAMVNNNVMLQVFVLVLELKKGPASTARELFDAPAARSKHPTVTIEPICTMRDRIKRSRRGAAS